MGGKERATRKVIHIHSELNNRVGVGKSVCLSILTWLCLVLNHVQLCNPMDYSPSGSSVHGILQARILEWVAMHSSRGSSQPKIKLRSPALQADSLLSEPPGRPQIPEWVAYPFSRGSSQPRNQTGASCTAGRLFLRAELPGKPSDVTKWCFQSQLSRIDYWVHSYYFMKHQ